MLLLLLLRVDVGVRRVQHDGRIVLPVAAVHPERVEVAPRLRLRLRGREGVRHDERRAAERAADGGRPRVPRREDRPVVPRVEPHLDRRVAPRAPLARAGLRNLAVAGAVGREAGFWEVRAVGDEWVSSTERIMRQEREGESVPEERDELVADGPSDSVACHGQPD